MPASYFQGQTLDDVMRLVFEEIMTSGERVKPTKGWITEVTGVLLEITDPRARLSRTETRGKPFSCLGELCWYLAKTNNLDFISYYIPDYQRYADGSEIYGAYGPRLFDWRGQNQVANVIEILRRKRNSRQAVIQLFDAIDIFKDPAPKDIPCTCTIQFMVRGEKLHMFTNMRSNDAYLGLPHDIFSFTMLQELIARSLGVELGHYKHSVGSLHIYDENLKSAQDFLKEGWQSTDTAMSPMPMGDPWPSIESLLAAEAVLRSGGPTDEFELDGLDPYWQDLIRLLQVLRCSKDKDAENILELRERMSSDVYRPFIDNRIA